MAAAVTTQCEKYIYIMEVKYKLKLKFSVGKPMAAQAIKKHMRTQVSH